MDNFGVKYLETVKHLGRINTGDKVKALLHILLHEYQHKFHHLLNRADWHVLLSIYRCTEGSCLLHLNEFSGYSCPACRNLELDITE